jgi:hypothetical protein
VEWRLAAALCLRCAVGLPPPGVARPAQPAMVLVAAARRLGLWDGDAVRAQGRATACRLLRLAEAAAAPEQLAFLRAELDAIVGQA